MKRLMALRLPNWPVQRLLAERPELRAGPVVLHRRDPRRGEQVVAACRRAREAGVRVGVPLAEAVTMVEAAACPYDPAADLAGLGRLAEHCEQFSPKVGWQTVSPNPLGPWYGESPAHLFLDVTGIPQLFGGEWALTSRVVAACRGLRYAARVAVTETLGAAWAVAGTGGMATVIPPGGVKDVLRPLPVEVLRLPDDTTAVLSRLGVRWIDDLLQLPRAALASRFGPVVALRLDQAFGAAPEVLVPHRPPPVFEAAERFDYPTERRDVLDQVAAGLIDRVAEDLRGAGRGALRLVGEFGCGPDQTVEFEVNLYRPTDLAKPMLELAKLHCDQLALPGPVDRVRLRADQTVPLRPAQVRLFADPHDVASGPLGELFERLTGRLGAAAALRPVWQADPLPERAVRFVPLVGGGPRPRVSASTTKAPAVGDRPLRLLDPPPRIDAGPDSDGPPAWFRWRRRHAVVRWWGPERIETRWWRTGLVRRDYYRVETDSDGRYWLFRDLVTGAWHLHGRFV